MKSLLLNLRHDGLLLIQTGTGWEHIDAFQWQSGYDLSGSMTHSYESISPWPDLGLLTRLIVKDGRIVEAVTDHAGAYPLYQARTANDDLILGSEAWTVARAAGLTRLDAESCFQMLSLEYVPGDLTLIEGLSELTAASRWCFEWINDHWTTSTRRLWRLARQPAKPGDFHDDEKRAVDNLRFQTRPIVAEAEKADRPLALNLSGGWDSRALLGCLYGLGPGHLFTCTYGNPDFGGVKVARQLSAGVGIPNHFAPFHNGDHLKTDFAELIANSAPTTRFNLGDGGLLVSRQFYADAFAACSGHSGDIFTALPANAKETQFDSPDEQIKWLLRNAVGAWPEHILESLARPESRQLARVAGRSMKVSVNENFEPGYGGLYRWKLENRIRRGVVAELRVLQQHADVIFLPMLHRSFLEFWVNRPAEQLRNQKLYRRALGNEMFTGPLEILKRLPREGGGKIMNTGIVGSAAHRVRKKTQGAARRLFPGMASRHTMADPTALWWQSNESLRAWAMQLVEDSDFIQEHFDEQRLRDFLASDNRLNPWLARIGIWNLLTIAGVEQQIKKPTSE